MHCEVLSVDACQLLLGRPLLFDNHVIYDGHTAYSLSHNGCSLTLTSLPPPKPHNIKLEKENKKSLYKSKTQVEFVTSKSKLQIVLLIVKSNIS